MVTRRFFLIASSAKSLGQIADVLPGMSLHQFLIQMKRMKYAVTELYANIIIRFNCFGKRLTDNIVWSAPVSLFN